MLFALQFGT